MVGLLDLRARSQSDVTGAEMRGVLVIYGLVASSKRRRGKSMWVIRGFEFRLSLLPPLPQLEFWSADCRLPSFDQHPLSRNLSFISFFSFDQIKSGFLRFLPWRSRIGRKITFNYYYFFFFFGQISSTFRYSLILCAETPFFPFWRKFQHR